MDVFEVRFLGGSTTNAGIWHHTSHIMVTAQYVQLVIRMPLLPGSFPAWIPIAAFCFCPLALEFDFFTGYTVGIFLLQYSLIPSIGAFLLCLLPLRRKRLTFKREELTCCEAHECEVILATSKQQVVLTLPTTDGARMLVKTLCEDIEEPDSSSIHYGRDLLEDNSGFTYLAPVIISIEQDVLTLRGAIMYSRRKRTIATIIVLLVGILLPFLVIKMDPFSMLGYYFLIFFSAIIAGTIIFRVRIVPDARIFPRTALQNVEAVNRYLTFVLPDTNKQQRRYTLQTESPEEACLLAQRLRQQENMAWQAVCHLNMIDKDDATLIEAAPYIFAHPGTITFNEESVTFHGVSGIPDSRTVRFSLLFSLFAFILFLPLIWQATKEMQFSLSAHIICMLAFSMLPTLLCVYIPASIFFAHIFASHQVVPRKQVSLIKILGNELTLHYGSPSRADTISVLARTSSEVQLLQEKLSATR